MTQDKICKDYRHKEIIVEHKGNERIAVLRTSCDINCPYANRCKWIIVRREEKNDKE